MLSACRRSRAPNLSAWPHDDLSCTIVTARVLRVSASVTCGKAHDGPGGTRYAVWVAFAYGMRVLQGTRLRYNRGS